MISHKLLGTQAWFVIHHTNCGMEFFTNDVIGVLLENSLETAALQNSAWVNPHHGGGSPECRSIDWLTIPDRLGSVAHDVRRIRAHPLVPGHIPIYGFLYDVASGRLEEVADASAAGRPTADAPS